MKNVIKSLQLAIEQAQSEFIRLEQANMNLHDQLNANEALMRDLMVSVDEYEAAIKLLEQANG